MDNDVDVKYLYESGISNRYMWSDCGHDMRVVTVDSCNFDIFE